MPLPAPVSNPKALPGERHAYPATREELSALADVRAGDQFTYRGDHYLATEDARTYARNGFDVAFVSACQRNGAMPSGWSLGDISASRQSGEG